MAIIGQHSDLYSKVVSEGSKFRDLKYSDVSDTEPLVSSGIPEVTSGETNPIVTSEVTSKVTARIDDSIRIAKLLTKYQGIKWEAHNVELASIQQHLAEKRGQYAGDDNNRSFWANLWKGVQKAADITAITLAQTAVAGTGEHFSAWQNSTYLKKGGGFFSELLNFASQDGGAAAEALATGHVTIHTDDPVEYYQLPTEDGNILEQAQKPKREGTVIDPLGFSPDGTKSWRTFNIDGEYEKLEETVYESYAKFGDVSEQIVQAQKPKRKGTTITPTREVGGGDPGTSWSLENSWSGSYAEEQGITKHGKFPNPSESPDDHYSKGPWTPEGAHKLYAKTAQGKDGKSASDGDYNVNSTDRLSDLSENANTRVDNGRIEMIPFWIRAITPYGDPLFDNGYLFFEANLDSYTDNYDASWQGTQYVGRADKFWTYTGFDRQINFAFKMVAHSKSHLKPLYNRLNGLLSMTAPNYGDGTFMRGTLAEITIGDLLSRQLGFIRNVGLKWETDYMWETDAGTIRVPHVLDVSVGFTPIHRFVPETRRRYFELANVGQGGSSKGSLGEEPFGLFTANAPVGENGSSGYKIYDFQK